MATYTIKSGDTLSNIAKQYGTTADVIAKSNNISNPNSIKAGSVLNIGGAPVNTPVIPKGPVAPKATTVPSPSITNFDITTYRDKLNSLLQPKPSNSFSWITSGIYPTAPKPTATPFYPTPDGTPNYTPAPTNAPAPTTTGSYVVKAGDSLSKIAAANKMTLQQLLALNPTHAQNPNSLQVGSSIKVSGSAGAPVANGGGSPANGGGGSPAGGTPPSGAPEGGTPPVVPTDPNELAKAAAEAGLSITEYQALMDKQNVVSKEESDKIKQELGIPALETAVFKKPSKSSEQIFNAAYASAGLADVKTKIAALDDEISKARSDLTEATGAIDENPFLTETSRVGRGKRVLDQAEQKINNLLSQKQQYADLYTQGITEINNSILRQQNDFKVNNDLSVAQLNYLVAKADKEVAQLKDTKGASSAAMGSLSAYLSAAASNKAPTTIGNSESGFYKYDNTTKKFVQVIAPSDLSKAQAANARANAANNGTDSTFKPTADQKALVGRFANSTEGVALGITPSDKAKMFTDPNFFYWLLQKATESGFY